MGAPGSSYWTGSIFVYNITTNTYKAYLDTNNQVKFGSYLGTITVWQTGIWQTQTIIWQTQIIVFLTDPSNYK